MLAGFRQPAPKHGGPFARRLARPRIDQVERITLERCPRDRNRIERFATLSGRKLDPRQIDELKRIGFVETLPNGFIRVTDKGWPVLDAVVADLAA
jgi:hypothetical protein